MAGIPCPRTQSIMEQFNPALENLVYLGNNYLRAFHGESTLVLSPCPHWSCNYSSAPLLAAGLTLSPGSHNPPLPYTRLDQRCLSRQPALTMHPALSFTTTHTYSHFPGRTGL